MGVVGDTPDAVRVFGMADDVFGMSDDDPEATVAGAVLDWVVGLLVPRRFPAGPMYVSCTGTSV
jgi:hypothetical protein